MSLLEAVFSSVKWKDDWAREKAGWEEEDLTGTEKLVKCWSGGRQAAGWSQGPWGGGESRKPDTAEEPRGGL